MNDIKPLPPIIQNFLKSYGLDPEELQIAVKTAYENYKKEENKNDL